MADLPPEDAGSHPSIKSPKGQSRHAKPDSGTANNLKRFSSPSTKTKDSQQSLQHIITTSQRPADAKSQSKGQEVAMSASKNSDVAKRPILWVEGSTELTTEKDSAVAHDPTRRTSDVNVSQTTNIPLTRRNANGAVGSVYSGNKIRHLKKEDGVPLWRKDIQLNFLECVFKDKTKCFTKASTPAAGPVHTFADIYIDAMARSSKTSKVLKDKLLADQEGAMHMAMICLLVNIGRMNTTLNFFPEMRAQLRTFHPIPSLQANNDPNAYKQLQDAPRLKSILKGASEDQNQPATMDKIKALPVPRTNPVNLIFVLSAYAPKISELHFPSPRDFFDLVMRHTLSSKSRANNFLWLIWFYLESDFSAEMALKNPFGPGQKSSDSEPPFKVPQFEYLTEDLAEAENVDTEEEIRYGEIKRQERLRILQEDETVGPPPKKGKKSQGVEDPSVIAISDNDPTRSPSPSSNVRQKPKPNYYNGALSSFESNLPPIGQFGAPMTRDLSNSQRLVLKTRGPEFVPNSSSPAPGSSAHPAIDNARSVSHVAPRRARPETSHQKAVTLNRKMRIDHILHSQMQALHSKARQDRKSSRPSFGMMVMNRLRDLPAMYDSDDEYPNSLGPGGVVPGLYDIEDYGEEALYYKKSIDRAIRRLHRDENGVSNDFPRGSQGRKRKGAVYAINKAIGGGAKKRRKEEEKAQIRPERGSGEAREELLDDLDRDLLGEGGDDEEMEETGGDDTEQDELTEEEIINGH